jgi:putative transposase
VPGLPHHVVHRGNNGQTVLTDELDYGFLHGVLVEQSRQHDVAVHAYSLLPTELHLLVTPQSNQALGRLMQGIGRAYGRHFNARHGRTGTLWEGRFRSGLLQPDKHLLDCMTLLDQLPVRAGLVTAPAEWSWSSHAHYIGRRPDRLISAHPAFWHMWNTPFAREQAYAERVAAGLPASLEGALSDAARHGWVFGDEAFVAGLQHSSDRRLTKRRPGRPRTKEA